MPTEAYINANVVPRVPSRFEVSNRFSVEIRPTFSVPNLVENEHSQIRQLFEADLCACYFGVNAAISTLF